MLIELQMFPPVDSVSRSYSPELAGLEDQACKTPAHQDNKATTGSTDEGKAPPVIKGSKPEDYSKIKLQEPGSSSELEDWTPGHHEILRFKVWRLFVKVKQDPRAKARPSDETILYCFVTKSNQEKGMGVWDFILHLQQYGLGTYTPVAREGEFTKDTKLNLPDEAFRCIVNRWYATDYRDFTKNSMNVEVYLDHVWSFEDVIWRLNDLGFISSPSSMMELRERYVPRKQHQVVKGSARCLEFNDEEAVVTEMKDGDAGSSGVHPENTPDVNQEDKEEGEEDNGELEGKKRKLKDARRLIEDVQESLDESTEVLDVIVGKKTVHFVSESEDSGDESNNEDEDEGEKNVQEEEVVIVEDDEEDMVQGNDVEILKSKIRKRDAAIKKKNEYIEKLQISNKTTLLRLRRTKKSGLKKGKSLVKAVETYFEKGNPSLKSMIEELYTDNREILSLLKIKGTGPSPPAAPGCSFKRPDNPRPPAPVPRADMAPVQTVDQWSSQRIGGTRGTPLQHQRYQQQ